jgi:hypothetical protein
MMSSRAKRGSKIMDMVVYLALKSTQQATYSELYREFVVKHGWSKNTLNAYLSLLHKRGVITRSWLKYEVDGKEKKFRIYRLNRDYFKNSGSNQSKTIKQKRALNNQQARKTSKAMVNK